MKKLFKILFFLSCISSTIAAQAFNNLMMILGDEVGNGAMTSTLAQALNDQTYPVLVSGQGLLNYLELAQNSANIAMAKQIRLKMIEKNISNLTFPAEIDLIKQALPLIKHSCGEDAKNVANDFKICFVKPLSNNDWHAYRSLQSNFILLIPKYCINQRVDKAITNPDDQVRACGFNVDAADLVRINNVTPKDLTDLLRHNEMSVINKPYCNIIDSITSFFLKNTSDAAEASSWHIYLTGHGSPACVQTITNQSFFLASSCLIAGIPFNDFANLMRFFNNEIKTSFLYYCSCFAGGRNRTFVNKILNDISSNFMVVTEGSSELTVSTTGLASSYLFTNDSENISIGFYNHYKNYKKFFTRLQECFSICKSNEHNKHFDLIMCTIISNVIISDTVRSNNQPFVRIPHSKNFKSIPVDNSVTILTENDIKEHASKIVDVKNKKAVLAYPPYVEIPLELGEDTLIISGIEPELAPQDFLGVSFEQQTIQFFEKIICENYLWKFVSNLVSYNPLHNRIFLINKLQTWDYDGTKLSGENALSKVIIHIFALPKTSTPYAGLISMDVIYKKKHLYHAEWERDDFFQQLKRPYKTPELVLNFRENKAPHAIKEHINTFDALTNRIMPLKN